MNWSTVKEWIMDPRTWIPLLFWMGLLILDAISGGDYTNLLSRSANIGMLIVMAVMAFLFINSMTDYNFMPDVEWEDLWRQSPIAVSIILAGQYILSGLIAAAIINPF